MFSKNNPSAKMNEPQALRSGRVGASGSAAAEGGVGAREPSPAAGFGQGLASLAGRRDETAATGQGRMTVGSGVKLKGVEIVDCDMLVVEGEVEGTMPGGGLRIGESGRFKGTVTVDVAEVQGVFEGELTATKQLIVKSSGKVSGKTRYGKLSIEEGGQISGDIGSVEAAVASSRVDAQPVAGAEAAN